MRKIQKIIIVVAILVLGLTGCSKEKALSNEEALSVAENVWDNYREMHIKLWGTGLVTGSITEASYATDVLLACEGDYTIAKLKQETEKVCTGEFAQKKFYDVYLDRENPIYVEVEGALYMRPVGVVYDLAADTFELLSVESDEIQVKITGDVNEITKLQDASYNVTFILQDGSWLIDEVEIIN